MAFDLSCTLSGYEFRGYDGGKLDDGTEWHKLILESPDTKQLRVTVGLDLWDDVRSMGLRKGDVLVMPVQVASGMYQGKHYDRVRLNDLPQVLDDDGVLS